MVYSKNHQWHTYIYRTTDGIYRCTSVVNNAQFKQKSLKNNLEVVARLESLSGEEKDGLYGCYGDRRTEDVITGIVRQLNEGKLSFDLQRALDDLHRAVCVYLSKRIRKN